MEPGSDLIAVRRQKLDVLRAAGVAPFGGKFEVDGLQPGAYTILAEAISSKQQVVARYHDEERIFSPHALGSKRGVAHVLVYQYAGGSRTGLPPGGEWRCLSVEELSEVRLESGAWRTAAHVSNHQPWHHQADAVANPHPQLPPWRPRGSSASPPTAT